MDIGGCLREWKQVVNDLWETAAPLINEEDVMKIAHLTVDKLPSIKGLVTSIVYRMKVPNDGEKNERILQLETLDDIEKEILVIRKLVSDKL